MFSTLNTHAKKIHRLSVALFCLIFWQSCFKFRTSDPDAVETFQKKNVPVKIGYYPYAEGKTLHYVESGDSTAPTVYFIHGTPGSWNNFQNFLMDSLLVSKYRMISIDRPGFGYSNFGKAITMEEQVALFNRFIREHNNGQPVVLAGHSLGGPIIVGMAATDTTIAHTLLLLAASVSPDLEPAENWRKPLSLPVIRGLAPGAFKPSNVEMLDFKAYVKKMPQLLGNVRCTTYVIHGTKDMFVPYGNLAYAEKFLTNDAATNLITMEGENHFIPWTKFEDLRALLLYIYPGLK
jgi:pimeloyl-ACP methyl ester carboxylesterase